MIVSFLNEAKIIISLLLVVETVNNFNRFCSDIYDYHFHSEYFIVNNSVLIGRNDIRNKARLFSVKNFSFVVNMDNFLV
jgi:hypothetical protein